MRFGGAEGCVMPRGHEAKGLWLAAADEGAIPMPHIGGGGIGADTMIDHEQRGDALDFS